MVQGCLAAPCLLSGQPGARQERASPALLGARRGEERDGDRKGRVAPREGSHQVGEWPAPPGQVVPFSLTTGWRAGLGGQHAVGSGPE